MCENKTKYHFLMSDRSRHGAITAQMQSITIMITCHLLDNDYDYE